jgi:hypothetical protein
MSKQKASRFHHKRLPWQGGPPEPESFFFDRKKTKAPLKEKSIENEASDFRCLLCLYFA